MSVEEATLRDIAGMPEEMRGSSLAASALALARELDSGTSATSKSMCARAHLEIMMRLRDLSPPEEKKDQVDEIGARRIKRLERNARTADQSGS